MFFIVACDSIGAPTIAADQLVEIVAEADEVAADGTSWHRSPADVSGCVGAFAMLCVQWSGSSAPNIRVWILSLDSAVMTPYALTESRDTGQTSCSRRYSCAYPGIALPSTPYAILALSEGTDLVASIRESLRLKKVTQVPQLKYIAAALIDGNDTTDEEAAALEAIVYHWLDQHAVMYLPPRLSWFAVETCVRDGCTPAREYSGAGSIVVKLDRQ
jgi:hypothetical protein